MVGRRGWEMKAAGAAGGSISNRARIDYPGLPVERGATGIKGRMIKAVPPSLRRCNDRK